jgi:hypothetical protein
MSWRIRVLFLGIGAVLSASGHIVAQTESFDPSRLQVSLSQGQFDSLTNLTPRPLPCPPQTRAQVRRPDKVSPPLTAQQQEFRDAVKKLGKHNHNFVHVELANGKVETGAIIAIDDRGFQLRNGILHSHHVDYAQLKTQPRRVAAVGTHFANGFKWAGLGTTIGVACVLAIPVAIVLIPLMLTGAISD